jgi:RNA polymerase sigma factor (sigma-70 family)
MLSCHVGDAPVVYQILDAMNQNFAEQGSADATGEEGTPASESRADLVVRLFESHHTRFVSFLTAKVGSRQEAEDLAQKAYEELLTVKREGPASFLAAYLFRTGTNLAINRLRQKARIQEVETLASHEVPRFSPSPEPQCIARERIQLVNQALQQLPAKMRMVFMLRTYSDLTYQQIVARMAQDDVKIDQRTAMRWVERALVHCKEFIAAAEDTRRGANEDR